MRVSSKIKETSTLPPKVVLSVADFVGPRNVSSEDLMYSHPLRPVAVIDCGIPNQSSGIGQLVADERTGIATLDVLR